MIDDIVKIKITRGKSSGISNARNMRNAATASKNHESMLRIELFENDLIEVNEIIVSYDSRLLLKNSYFLLS